MKTGRWLGAWCALAVLGASPGVAATSVQDPAPAEEQVDALIDEFDEAMAAFRELYQAAKTDEERQKAFEESYPDPSEWFDRFLAVAEEHPGSEAAVRALVWIVQRSNGDDERATRAQDYLRNDYLLSPHIGPFCEALAGRIDAESEAALRRVLEENPDATAKGSAAFALARSLGEQAKLAARFAGGANAAERQQYERYYGKESLDRLAAADAAALQKESEALFQRVVDQHADVEGAYGKLGELAAGELFELRNLQIGMAAPDIQGEDIDGVPFKLSDYRGKVVLLDFWGHW